MVWGPGLAAVAVSLLSLPFLEKQFPTGGLVFPLGIRVHYPGYLSLVVIGALTAYSSRRLGGSLAHRILASLFPAFWGVLSTVIRWVVFSLHPSPSDLLFVMLTRVVVPSAALLLGAALFLRDSRRRTVGA